MLPAITSRRNVTGRLFDELASELDWAFGNAFDGGSRTNLSWAPPADLCELENAYVLRIDVPGLERDDIELTVEDGVFTVRGAYEEEAAEEDATWHLRERGNRRFVRSFRLPTSVDRDAVGATLSNGILEVTLPKVADARPRRIEVRGN